MNILLAVDQSRDAELAVQFLMALPLPDDTNVTLLYVLPPSQQLAALGESPDFVKRLSTMRQMTKAKAEQFIGAIHKHVSTKAWKVHPLVMEGSPADEIVRMIEQHHIDLCIVGTRGISGIQRFVLGSVSEQVLNYAACSVCIVREEPEWGKATTSRGMRILLATDGSSDAKAAMKFLNHMELSSSEVHVLHVMDTKHDLPIDQEESNKPELVEMAESIREHRIRAGTIVLQEIHSDLQQKFRLEALARGHAAEEIIKAAERLQPDLLIVGSRGLHRITRGLLGSVSHNVARHALCSVLVVRQVAHATKVKI